MAVVSVTDLTTEVVGGTGVFDKLMKTTLAHIEQEYAKNRIRGPEYATVYLGALQSVLDRAIQFLLAQQRTDLEAQLLTVQVANATKEGALLDEQILQATAQTAQIQGQTLLIAAQKLQADAQTTLLGQEFTKAVSETAVLDQTVTKLVAETSLLTKTEDKITAEEGLLNQKTVTELAQVSATGVSTDSIVGRQKQLYERQSDGFLRDAEQKAAKTMIDTWNVRRTTDSGTVADATNKLNDATIGSIVQKLLDGVDV